MSGGKKKKKKGKPQLTIDVAGAALQLAKL